MTGNSECPREFRRSPTIFINAVKNVCKETSGSREVFRVWYFQSNMEARFEIESMHGKRVPKILHRLKKRFNLKQVCGDIEDFETFYLKCGQLFIIEFFTILRKKNYQQKSKIGPISLVQHEQFSKLKYFYSELVFLFFSKTYQTFDPDVFSSISMVCN